MNDAARETGGFIRQRRAGMTAIAAAMPVALLLWLAIDYLAPPLSGMDSLNGRMLFTLKCCSVAVLFCLVTGVEAVGAPGMALSMIVLLYVAGRIGYEVGGFIGAAVPVVLFLAVEAFLFRATRPLRSADHP